MLQTREANYDIIQTYCVYLSLGARDQYGTYQVRRRVSNQSRLNQQGSSQHSFLYC